MIRYTKILSNIFGWKIIITRSILPSKVNRGNSVAVVIPLHGILYG